jgi:DNA-binding transcriptional ArsR family regulator
MAQNDHSPDRLSLTFAALADPTRRRILASLCRGETCVTKLAEPFDMTLPAITKHLKVLERAGLITRRHDAQRRLCCLQDDPLEEAGEWIAAARVADAPRIAHLPATR